MGKKIEASTEEELNLQRREEALTQRGTFLQSQPTKWSLNVIYIYMKEFSRLLIGPFLMSRGAILNSDWLINFVEGRLVQFQLILICRIICKGNTVHSNIFCISYSTVIF